MGVRQSTHQRVVDEARAREARTDTLTKSLREAQRKLAQSSEAEAASRSMLEAEREATSAAMSNTQDNVVHLQTAIAAEQRKHSDLMERQNQEHAKSLRQLEKQAASTKAQYSAQVDELTRQLAAKTAAADRSAAEVAKLRQQLARHDIKTTNLEETVSVLEEENADLRALSDSLSEKLRRMTTSFRKSLDLSDTESNFGWGEGDERLFSEDGEGAPSPGHSSMALPGGPLTPGRHLSDGSAHTPVGFDRTPATSPSMGTFAASSTPAASSRSALRATGAAIPPPPDFDGSVQQSATIEGDVFTFDELPPPPSPPPGIADPGEIPPPPSHGELPRVGCASIPGWDVGKVGLRVLVSRYGPGTLRWVGRHAVHGEPRCGVELDAAIGKNDGSVGEHRYFSCDLDRGVLAKPSRLTLLGADGGAATAALAPLPAATAAIGPSMAVQRYAEGVAALHTADGRPITWLEEDDASSQATDPQDAPQFDVTNALSL